MLDLREITLWSMVWNDDSRWIQKVVEVLEHCNRNMTFARTILFSHGPVDCDFETISIPQLDWKTYNIFVNRVVPTFIKSEFAMTVHEDGFPIDFNLWDPAFLHWDFIGAPWEDKVVGNSGFCIESKKLLDMKCDMVFSEDDFRVNSDRIVCTTRRSFFEDGGIKFAPYDLAKKFSTEQIGGELPSFGFHGRNVSREKYRKGWLMVRAIAKEPRQQNFYLQRNKVVKPPRHVPVQSRRQFSADIVIPPASQMKITMVYVYAVVAGKKYDTYAQRFIENYTQNPPGLPHETFIMLNGSQVTPEIEQMFSPIGNLRFIPHDNTGYDLGAFQKASRMCTSDMIVFFGASTFIRRSGWLKKMAEAMEGHGLAQYGAMGNRGDKRYSVSPHIRTTAFWMHPTLFNAYPKRIRRAQERHAFEHGSSCFTSWVETVGLKSWVITWGGDYLQDNWDDDPNGYQRGNQSNLLAGDHICEPPYYPR